MNAQKSVALVLSLVVLGAVLIGLYLSGSPGDERLRRLDIRRVGDLSQLSRAFSAHWEKFESLPPELSALLDGQILRSLPTDPESRAEYIYEIADPASYSLCAEFSASSDPALEQEFWSHGAGLQCFNFSL